VSDLSVRRGSAETADLVTIEIEADGFLYNMVRAIVGTLVEVGRGAQAETWPGEVLAAADRRAGAMTAPPHGLVLVRVDYAGEDGKWTTGNTARDQEIDVESCRDREG